MNFIRQECSHRYSQSHNLLLQLLQLARQWIDTHICMERTACRHVLGSRGREIDETWSFSLYASKVLRLCYDLLLPDLAESTKSRSFVSCQMENSGFPPPWLGLSEKILAARLHTLTTCSANRAMLSEVQGHPHSYDGRRQGTCLFSPAFLRWVSSSPYSDPVTAYK